MDRDTGDELSELYAQLKKDLTDDQIKEVVTLLNKFADKEKTFTFPILSSTTAMAPEAYKELADDVQQLDLNVCNVVYSIINLLLVYDGDNACVAKALALLTTKVRLKLFVREVQLVARVSSWRAALIKRKKKTKKNYDVQTEKSKDEDLEEEKRKKAAKLALDWEARACFVDALLAVLDGRDAEFTAMQDAKLLGRGGKFIVAPAHLEQAAADAIVDTLVEAKNRKVYSLAHTRLPFAILGSSSVLEGMRRQSPVEVSLAESLVLSLARLARRGEMPGPEQREVAELGLFRARSAGEGPVRFKWISELPTPVSRYPAILKTVLGWKRAELGRVWDVAGTVAEKMIARVGPKAKAERNAVPAEGEKKKGKKKKGRKKGLWEGREKTAGEVVKAVRQGSRGRSKLGRTLVNHFVDALDSAERGYLMSAIKELSDDRAGAGKFDLQDQMQSDAEILVLEMGATGPLSIKFAVDGEDGLDISILAQAMFACVHALHDELVGAVPGPAHIRHALYAIAAGLDREKAAAKAYGGFAKLSQRVARLGGTGASAPRVKVGVRGVPVEIANLRLEKGEGRSGEMAIPHAVLVFGQVVLAYAKAKWASTQHAPSSSTPSSTSTSPGEPTPEQLAKVLGGVWTKESIRVVADEELPLLLKAAIASNAVALPDDASYPKRVVSISTLTAQIAAFDAVLERDRAGRPAEAIRSRFYRLLAPAQINNGSFDGSVIALCAQHARLAHPLGVVLVASPNGIVRRLLSIDADRNATRSKVNPGSFFLSSLALQELGSISALAVGSGKDEHRASAEKLLRESTWATKAAYSGTVNVSHAAFNVQVGRLVDVLDRKAQRDNRQGVPHGGHLARLRLVDRLVESLFPASADDDDDEADDDEEGGGGDDDDDDDEADDDDDDVVAMAVESPTPAGEQAGARRSRTTRRKRRRSDVDVEARQPCKSKKSDVTATPRDGPKEETMASKRDRILTILASLSKMAVHQPHTRPPEIPLDFWVLLADRSLLRATAALTTGGAGVSGFADGTAIRLGRESLRYIDGSAGDCSSEDAALEDVVALARSCLRAGTRMFVITVDPGADGFDLGVSRALLELDDSSGKIRFVQASVAVDVETKKRLLDDYTASLIANRVAGDRLAAKLAARDTLISRSDYVLHGRVSRGAMEYAQGVGGRRRKAEAVKREPGRVVLPDARTLLSLMGPSLAVVRGTDRDADAVWTEATLVALDEDGSVSLSINGAERLLGVLEDGGVCANVSFSARAARAVLTRALASAYVSSPTLVATSSHAQLKKTDRARRVAAGCIRTLLGRAGFDGLMMTPSSGSEGGGGGEGEGDVVVLALGDHSRRAMGRVKKKGGADKTVTRFHGPLSDVTLVAEAMARVIPTARFEAVWVDEFRSSAICAETHIRLEHPELGDPRLAPRKTRKAIKAWVEEVGYEAALDAGLGCVEKGVLTEPQRAAVDVEIGMRSDDEEKREQAMRELRELGCAEDDGDGRRFFWERQKTYLSQALRKAYVAFMDEAGRGAEVTKLQEKQRWRRKGASVGVQSECDVDCHCHERRAQLEERAAGMGSEYLSIVNRDIAACKSMQVSIFAALNREDLPVPYTRVSKHNQSRTALSAPGSSCGSSAGPSNRG